MKHLLWFVCVLLVAATASAQEGSAPSSVSNAIPLVLEVRVQRIPQGELEAALRKELDKGKPGDVPQGQLELSEQASNVVRLTYRDALGHESTRDLYLPPNDPEALEKVTIAAANLVRDQAAALLAELEALRLAQEAAQPKAPPPAPPPAATVAPPPAPKPPSYDPCQPKQLIPFGFDLVPGVGSSSTPIGRQGARRLSVGLGGTISAGVKGLELSIGINIDRLGTCGLQLASGVNATLGPVHGVQLANVNLALGWLEGLQAGTVNFVGGDGHGAQLGVANVSWGRVRGAQLGIANFARGGVQGAQLSVLNLAFGPTPGQLGVLNIATGDNKVQLGVVNFVKGDTLGQLGVLNIATGNAIAQLGVLNIAHSDTRAQLGVVNVSRRASAPVGVLSIVRDGHTSFDAWASENGTLLAGITHGGDLVRNTFAAGTRVSKGGHTQTVFALGIGVRLWTDPRFNLDLNCLSEVLARFDPFKMRTQTERLKLDATVWLHERVGLVVGAGYALMITQDEGVKSQAWFGESIYRTAKEGSSGARAGLFGFPTFNLGVRVMLSDPKKRGR